MGALGDLLRVLSQLLPPWVVVLLVTGVTVLALPLWWDQVRAKRLKGLVRRMVRAQGEARAALVREAFEMARKPKDLLALAEAAGRLSQHDVLGRALAALEATGELREDARRLRGQTKREPARPVHPVEVAAVIERLLAEGATEAARLRLDEALARFPEDEPLLALEARLAEEAGRTSDARDRAIH